MPNAPTPLRLLLAAGEPSHDARVRLVLSTAGVVADLTIAPGLPSAGVFDLILLDAAADPEFAGLSRFTQVPSAPPVIVLAEGADAATARMALAAGAIDCLPPEALDERLLVHARWAVACMRAAERPRKDTAGPAHEDGLAHAARMAALARLAGGVAHDFNNLLTAIIGFDDLLLDRMGPHDPRFGDAQEIRKAALRGTELTQRLLEFGRQRAQQEPQPVDVNSVVAAFEQTAQRVTGGDVRLVVIGSPGLPRVKADAAQIEHVVMNLVTNARDAMREGGRVTIETSVATVDARRAGRHPGASAGVHVALAVSDTGSGMSDEVRSHLFEPFYTTKPRRLGTGLGLATVYGIVRQVGGFIEVHSRPGQGTRVEVLLPAILTPGPLPAAGTTTADQGTARGGETVLVVEDDQTVRDMIRELLERRGYRVLAAAGGAEAIRVAARFEGDIHLLLTDVVMPEMSGPGLKAQLVASRPAMRVLYMSGYTEQASILAEELQPGEELLQKPFPPSILVHRVRQALDRGRQDPD